MSLEYRAPWEKRASWLSLPMGRRFDRLIYQNWWVILLVILSFAAYEQALRHQRKSYHRLHARLTHLSQERESLLDYQKGLALQIRSQNDPAWVELTLMRVLGVIPEGHRKVTFHRGEREA